MVVVDPQYGCNDAYVRMKYRGEDTNTEEWVWNSRDGVTPFMISSRDGKELMKHVEFHLDERLPDYEPKVGERMFVRLAPEHAIEIARKYVGKNWDRIQYPMNQHSVFGAMTKDEAVGYYAATLVDDGNRPHLIEVTEEVLAKYREFRKVLSDVKEVFGV